MKSMQNRLHRVLRNDKRSTSPSPTPDPHNPHHHATPHDMHPHHSTAVTPHSPPNGHGHGHGAAQTPHRLRILCLHGYHGSASTMRSQVGSLSSVLAPYADLVFVDAPSLAHGDFGWWHARTEGNTGGITYQGWERTRDGLMQVFEKQGPFDGILGFSQGAILAGVLCGLNAYPEGTPDRSAIFKFDFAIMVGGFVARDSKLSRMYDHHRERYSLPSLHVYGRSDGIVSPHASAELSDMFKNPTTIVHDGGHVIASQGFAKNIWLQFIKDQWAAKFEHNGHDNHHSRTPSHDSGHHHHPTTPTPNGVAFPVPHAHAANGAHDAHAHHGAHDPHAHHGAQDPHAAHAAHAPHAPHPRPTGTTQLLLWPGDKSPRMRVYFPSADDTKHHPSSAGWALVIFRGGAYSTPRGSGGDAARWAADKGFVAVEVDYGTAASRSYWPQNVHDGMRAVRVVRSKAAEWGIHSDRVGVLGFSAGGHMAATLAVGGNIPASPHDDLAPIISARPDIAILAYGVLSFVDEYHPGAYLSTVDNFFGTRNVPDSLREQRSPDLQVKHDTPPIFAWTVRNDHIVPYTHTTRFADACKKAGVPVELRVYKQGYHGVGMAQGTGFDCEKWGTEFLAWLGGLHK